ncbi:MAG: sugar ABC transporter ATP-binding protein [Candidatus Atribacteria bacterium]|nr:sugar ABC transporter ATP-binding protein [Candidatus Atribacteria bacterium]
MANNNHHILEFKNITKYFPGTVALSDVSFEISKGEIFGLMGENGAGKSTLLNILSGAINESSGEIIFDGEKLSGNPYERRLKGISMVYQGLGLALELTAEENILLGNEMISNLGIINHKQQIKKAREVMSRIGVDFNLKMPVYDLSADEKQLVAIVRAISLNAKVIALDEPTSSLSRNEVDKLFNIIRTLSNEENISFIFVSHHLDEVFLITDRMAVLKDGKLQGVVNTKDVNPQSLTEMMVGSKIVEHHTKKFSKEKPMNEKDQVILEVKNLTRKGFFQDISFQLREGEILGFAGLLGSGRTDLIKSIFGAEPYDSGEIIFRGNKIKFTSPKDAIKNGIAYLTDDRLNEGILKTMSVGENIVIENLEKVSTKFSIINRSKNRKIQQEYIDRFSIKTTGINQPMPSLSGGNQQKALFARLVNTDCDFLLLNEPSRGIDVKVKEEVHDLMRDYVTSKKGRAIVMASSELPELISTSSRVVVMKQGTIADILTGEDINEAKIIEKMV